MGVQWNSELKMGVSEAVLERVGPKPDVDAMSKDDLSVLCKQLYEKACGVFGEKFDEEYQVKKRDMEIGQQQQQRGQQPQQERPQHRPRQRPQQPPSCKAQGYRRSSCSQSRPPRT